MTHTLRYSKKGAWGAYLKDCLPEHQEAAYGELRSGQLRIAKVLISEILHQRRSAQISGSK